jgi:hypothetical protein
MNFYTLGNRENDTLIQGWRCDLFTFYLNQSEHTCHHQGCVIPGISINDSRVKPALEKNIRYYATSLKQMPNFNLLLTLTSDINGVLFAFSIQFSFLIFVLLQLINTKNLYFSIQIANTSGFRAKQPGKICEGKI